MSIASAFKARARVLTTPGLLGVAPAEQALHAALVRRPIDGPPQLLDCHAFEGPPALSQLAAWRRKHGWSGAPANLLLEPGDYQIMPIEVPELPQAELAGVARWKVKDMLDYPAEEASVACVTVPGAESGSGRPRQALAVVTPRKTVAAWMERCHSSRFELHAIDIPELALRNLAALIPGVAACGLLHVGLVRTTLVMVWQGELCSFRRFEVSARQLLDAGPDERETLLERLALDLQRTSDAFERQFYAAALGPMHVVQEIEGLPLAEMLSRYVSQPVRAFKLHDHLAVSPTQPLVDVAANIDFVTAIGAALRDEEGQA
jgi:MSHA biogenesis protein MshI